MSLHGQNNFSEEERLNKYAQSATQEQLVYGIGSNVKSKKTRLKKGKRKFITQKLAMALIKVSQEQNDKHFVKRCRNTYYCQNKVLYKNGVIYSEYCKNRFCLTCLAKRKAILIEKYYPILKTWDNDLYFVTLTHLACTHKYLNTQTSILTNTLKKITNRYKKRYERSTGNKFRGLRSLECNFNPIRKTYNPHFHIIVESKEMAQQLRVDWINELGEKRANPKAQHIRKVESLEHDLIETIKYGGKIFSEPKAVKGILQNKYKGVYAKAFYYIMKSFESRRLFAHFGFEVPEHLKTKETIITTIKNGSTLTYLPSIKDWINLETSSLLTGYRPTKELIALLSNIDKKSH